jgi:hypothetical protein
MAELPLLRDVRMPNVLAHLDDVVAAVDTAGDPLFIRHSEGPEADEDSSVDVESGLDLPGLSVNPLRPEDWWTRPARDWIARQICQYRQLQESNTDRFAWALTGVIVGRGPDCEPLLRGVIPFARIDDLAVDEAAAHYAARFDAGRGPED